MKCASSMIRLLALAALAFSGGSAAAYPVNSTLTVNSAQSPLTISAEATFFLTFRDSDTHNLQGTVNATFDLGSTGAFPASAVMNLTSSAVTHSQPYQLTLGPEQATVTGLVANVTTPEPHAIITRDLTQPGIVYTFDASQYLLTLVDGTVVATGFVDETIDLETQNPPVAGRAPGGTTGSVSFAVQGVSGPYSLIASTLRMPIAVSDTVTFDNIDVDLDLTGTIVAQSQFYAALSPITADFDRDGDVDNADLARWGDGFGATVGATVSQGNADDDGDVDGADFLAWQRARGTAPPALPGVAAVPEPGAATLLAIAAATIAGVYRCRRLHR